MSKWEDNHMDDRIRTALNAVHLNNPGGHHFGRPFLSSYQLAIALDADDAALKHVLGKELGGVGTGARDSLAQYISNELSKQIKTHGNGHYAQGAFMSNE